MNELSKAISRTPSLKGRVRFAVGMAEALPIGNASVDLVWCRDVLVHVQALDKAFAEMARVLRDHGQVIVYNTFGTNHLEPQEAAWLWRTMGVFPSSADPLRVDDAIRNAGFQIDQNIDLRSEWGERAEEESEHGTRRLLHAARLTRSPEQYISAFGKAAYDMMLGDCLWHIYRMIGKLSSRACVLSKPPRIGH